MNASDAKYQSIVQQFNHGMAKKSLSKTVLGVVQIWDSPRHKKYQSYLQKVGNEKRWWHGSNFKCDLRQNLTVCGQQGCAICGIVENNFLIKMAGTKFNWTRFGNGLYFAPDACKSNDYTSQNASGERALILSKVAVGKCYTVYQDQHFTAPPPGYDSILGEVGQGLNFPELVLFTEEAVCPSYVVFYR